MSTPEMVAMLFTQFEDAVKPVGRVTQNTPFVRFEYGLKENVRSDTDFSILMDNEIGLLAQVVLLQVMCPGSVELLEPSWIDPIVPHIKFRINSIITYYLKVV